MVLKKKKIMVVDDSRTIRNMIKRELEKGDYDVIDVDSGIKALAKVHLLKPDLITLDIEMPGLNGFETFEKLIKESEPNKAINYEKNQIPVIFITSRDTLKDRMRGYELGALDFISKTFQKGDILSAVNKILKPKNYLQGLTALVVNADPVASTILTKNLKQDGLKVINAKNGIEAFKILIKQAKEINIVITDLHMPMMEGDELCQKIRNELDMKDIPVIVLTSSDDRTKIFELFKVGATDYIVKPFVKEELLARLSVHIELEQAHKKLKKSIKVAEKADRAKSDFLANMSHEIRTPMNGVIGMTSLLLDSELNDKQHHFAKIIQSSSESLLGLINDILDFSKIEAGKLEIHELEFDLKAFLDEFATMMAFRAKEKGLELICSVESDVPTYFTGDSDRLKQILTNLVGNAIKFTSNGKIVIACRLEKKLQNTCKLHFSVTDTGIGITKSKQYMLFNKFFQVDGSITREFGGTGLGLAISKQLSELMGGEIGIESAEDKGSTFWFTVVFKNLDKKSNFKTITKISSYNHVRGAKILVVEDNEINQHVAQALLSTAQVEATIADNGKNAIDIIKESIAKNNLINFDLILMDLQMPIMDGLEATKIIRELEEKYKTDKKILPIPIIAMTAHAMKSYQEKCISEGMNDYIIKPIDKDRFFSTLNKWIPEKRRNTIEIKDSDYEIASGNKNELPNELLISNKLFKESLPGIDFKKGLRKINNNDKLFFELLLEFDSNHSNDILKIKQALEKKDLENAKAISHTLKSTSGIIAASELNLHIVEINNNLNLNKKIEDSLLDDAQKSIENVISSVKLLEKKIKKENVINNSKENLQSKVEFNLDKIEPIIKQLYELLQKNNIDSEKYLKMLKGYNFNTAVEQDIDNITDLINKFKFEDARKKLEVIAKKLEITL